MEEKLDRIIELLEQLVDNKPKKKKDTEDKFITKEDLVKRGK